MPYIRFVVAVAMATALLPVAGAHSQLRDGKRFDPAATMTARAEGAPEQLDRVAWMVGHWDAEYTRHLDGDSTWVAMGRADITWMNRGHCLMERLHCPDFDGAGHELNTLSFIVRNANRDVWGWGIADSWRENIAVYNGGFDGDDLVLHNAMRHRGNLTLTHYRLIVHRGGDDAFTIVLSRSTDGEDFAPAVTVAYTRLAADDGLFTTASGYGHPAPGLPPEARQFDFLIGEWDLEHDMTFPNGRKAQWRAYGTAVHMLNGHCVMEYSSYDIDPQLPDAATTIVRLWNRQMRRWECMYTTNRFNGILHFGGVMEGDRIVLHQFGADASIVPINQWTFHDWKADSYGWYANTSRDRGETWTKTWIIQGTRR